MPAFSVIRIIFFGENDCKKAMRIAFFSENDCKKVIRIVFFGPDFANAPPKSGITVRQVGKCLDCEVLAPTTHKLPTYPTHCALICHANSANGLYKGTYRRNHEGDYHCTERQVRAMIRDSFEDGNDGMLLEHYDMNDIDIDTLHRYRTLFRYRNEGHVWNDVDDKTFLKNLGGYIVDRATGKEGLTMAGLMMFGKGLSVQERFANFRMDYIDFCNLIGDERYSDRLTYDGRWENNLYQFFSRVIPKVTADLPRPFHEMVAE